MYVARLDVLNFEPPDHMHVMAVAMNMTSFKQPDALVTICKWQCERITPPLSEGERVIMTGQDRRKRERVMPALVRQ